MITVTQRSLKAKMDEYFRIVVQTGEEVLITNKKKPVAKIIPIRAKLNVDDVFTGLRGTVKYSNPDDFLRPETDEWGDILADRANPPSVYASRFYDIR